MTIRKHDTTRNHSTTRETHQMTRLKFGRRDLMRGLGAGTLLLSPFARQVEAWAAGAPQGNFMVFYTPNGHVRSDFGATGTGSAFTLKSSLKALEGQKAKLTIVQDLDNPGASSKGSHEDCVRTLTCMPGSGLYEAHGPSIDWVVAQKLNQRPLTTSSLWSQAPNWQTKISWKAAKVFDPHVDDSKRIFADLFSNVTPTQTPTEVDTTHLQNKSVLDYVKEDINTLTGRLAAADKVKLSNHLDAIRELERKLTAAPGTGGGAIGAGCDSTSLKPAVDKGASGLSGASELQKELEIKMDLIATAFACGNRRVATLLAQGASSGRNPFGSPNHHDVSHGKGTDPKTVWKRIDAWYAERFSYMMKRLEDLQILDNTVIVWGSEISEQHDQRGFVMPVAGGAALGIANQRTFTGRNTLSNLWVSVQKAMGVDSDTFGAQSSGGIAGLYNPV